MAGVHFLKHPATGDASTPCAVFFRYFKEAVPNISSDHRETVFFLPAVIFKNNYRSMAELKNIRIAISGIYDYAFEELPSLQLPLPGQGAPEWVEKKRVYKVYRPATVLQAACEKFKLLPLTHHHPKAPVDGSNFRELAVGYTGENPFIDYLEDKKEVGIRNTLLIYDDEALNAYDNGEIQLSPGYVAEFEWNRGTTPKGEEYDIVMKKITDVNHLALLPCGRGGSDAVVMDGATKEKTIFDLAKETLDGAPEGNDNASKDHVKESTALKKIRSLKAVDVSKNKSLNKEEIKDVFEKIGSVTNKDDNETVTFPNKTAGKIFYHKGLPVGKIVADLKNIFENSIFAYSEPEKRMEGHKFHDNIEKYNNYVGKVNCDGNEYYVRFTTRKEKKGRKNNLQRHQTHSIAVSEVAIYENKKGSPLCLSVQTTGESLENPFIDDRLKQWFEKVNNQTTDGENPFILYADTTETIFDLVKNKKTLWSAPHAQTQQQDSALNYGAKAENKVLSDFARGECSKGLNDSIDDVFISDNEMKIACSEVTDSSIIRSNNGVGGQLRRQTGNKEKVNDAIASAVNFTPDTSRPGNLSSTETVIHSGEKRKSIFEIVSGSIFDRFK